MTDTARTQAALLALGTEGVANSWSYQDQRDFIVSVPNLTDNYAQLASYSGNAVTIANGINGYLTWDNLGSGVALLNLTDPTLPTVILGGIYSVTAVIQAQEAFTAGGGMQVTLSLDAGGQDAVCEMTGGQRVDSRILISLNSTYYIPAGGQLAARVLNGDGVAAHNFNLREALIQRIV